MGEDGERRAATQRSQLAYLASRGNETARKKLEEAECLPDTMIYLWDWYQELRQGAGGGGPWGGGGIGWQDVAAWAALLDRRPAPHEAEALLAVDRAVQGALRAQAKAAPAAKPAPRGTRR